MPMATPPAIALVNEVMPPITAAHRARLRVRAPRLATPVFGPPLLRRIIESVARNPPTVQTTVETVRGLMPARRDRLALSADAVTALPKVVRFSHHASSTAMVGTTIRIWRSGPVMISPKTSSHWDPTAVGKAICA